MVDITRVVPIDKLFTTKITKDLSDLKRICHGMDELITGIECMKSRKVVGKDGIFPGFVK